MAPCLATLPSELLEAVAQRFDDTDDWSSLRLTCRDLQLAVRNKWLKQHFSDRNVRIDEHKLSQLIEIGKVQELASRVECLTVLVQHEQISQRSSSENPMKVSATRLSMECAPLLALAFQGLRKVKGILFTDREAKVTEYVGEGDLATVDIASAFTSVMFAVQACGMRPLIVATLPTTAKRALNMSDTLSIPRLQAVLSQVKEFYIEMSLGSEDEPVDPEIGHVMGAHLASGINNMQRLTTLSLALESIDECADLMRHLSRLCFLPNLEELHLIYVVCEMDDLLALLRKHAGTLEGCILKSIYWQGSCFSSLLTELANLKLEMLMLEDLSPFGAPEMQHPGLVKFTDEPNEDGYIEVDHGALMWKSKAEVQAGIAELLRESSNEPS